MSFAGLVKSYLDSLSSADPQPGPASASVLTGAVAAALVAMSARMAFEGSQDPDLGRMAERAQEARGRLEGAVDTVSAATPDVLLETAQESAAVLDLAVEVFTRMPDRKPERVAGLAAAIALARAATEAAAQTLLVHLGSVSDDLARSSYKNRAAGLSQRARRVEADFMLAMVTSAGRTG